MQRTGQGGDTSSNGTIHSRKGAGDDACRKGRRIELVIGMQYQANVENTCFIGLGTFAAKHIKKVLGDAEAFVRSDRFIAVADTVPGGSDGADLARDPNGRFDGMLAVGAVAVLVIKIERGDGGPEHIHRIGILRKALHRLDDLGRHFIIPSEPFLQLGKLIGLGQAAVPQKINDLFEG